MAEHADVCDDCPAPALDLVGRYWQPMKKFPCACGKPSTRMYWALLGGSRNGG